MSEHAGDARAATSGRVLPLWAAEDYVCDRCRLVYARITVDDARARIEELPGRVRAAALAVPAAVRRRRPAAGVWSITEYVCHLRDVYITYTVRLHRTRTEKRPVLEPMLNDLRARRFGYNERDLGLILEELAATAGGFCTEIARTRPEDWERVAQRLPGEQRTARWLVRQALHEGVHHLGDIHAVHRIVTESR